MNSTLLLVGSILILSSTMIASDFRENHKGFQPGEYYEYDLEGRDSPRRKKAKGGSKKMIKAPWKATIWGLKKTGHGLKIVVNAIENFLRDSPEDGSREKKLRKALKDTEGDMQFADYYAHEEEHQKGRLLYGLPEDTYKLLKGIIYHAGFRLTRATLRLLRDAVVESYRTVRG